MAWSDSIAIFVVQFANYGLAVVVLMLIWEVGGALRHFFGGESGTDVGKGIGGWVKDKLPFSKKRQKRGKKLRKAKREKTRLLSALIEEEEELKSLKKAKPLAKQYDGAVKNIISYQKGNFRNLSQVDELDTIWNNLHQSLSEVFDRQHQWKQAERREVKSMKKLLKELERNGVKGETLRILKAQEQLCLDHYSKVEAETGRMNNFFGIVQGVHTEMISKMKKLYGKAARDVPKRLNKTDNKLYQAIQVNIPEGIKALDVAIKEEQKAIKATAVLAKEISDRWVVPK